MFVRIGDTAYNLNEIKSMEHPGGSSEMHICFRDGTELWFFEKEARNDAYLDALHFWKSVWSGRRFGQTGQ